MLKMNLIVEPEIVSLALIVQALIKIWTIQIDLYKEISKNVEANVSVKESKFTIQMKTIFMVSKSKQ